MSTTDPTTTGIPAIMPSNMGNVAIAADGTFLGRAPLTPAEEEAAWDEHARLHPDRAPANFGEAICLLAATRRLLAAKSDEWALTVTHSGRLAADLGEVRVALLRKSSVLAALEPTAIALDKELRAAEVETGDRPSASIVLLRFLRAMREVGAPC